MTGRLSQTVVVGGVIYPAGATVPADVAKDITAEGVWAEAPAPDAVDDAQGYDTFKVDELEAMINERNKGRDQADLIMPEGKKKADLVAALEADDAKG